MPRVKVGVSVTVGAPTIPNRTAPVVGHLTLMNPLVPGVTEPGKTCRGKQFSWTPADWAVMGGTVVVVGVLGAETRAGSASITMAMMSILLT